MEEKERYEYFFGTNTIKDNKTNQFYGCAVDLLNQQDKQIKELEEELDDAKRDYIPKLEFGLQRANKMGRDAEKENQKLKQQLVASESKRKILEEKVKCLFEENEECFVDGQKYNELKQQLHELPKKIVEDIKIQMGSIEDILINCGNGKEDALCWLNRVLETTLKKYGGEVSKYKYE